MAQIRSYTINLTPAEATDRGGFSCMLFDKNAKDYTVQAAGLPALEAEVRRIVREEFKQSAAVYVTLPRGQRGPPGFNAATAKYQFIPCDAPPAEAGA